MQALAFLLVLLYSSLSWAVCPPHAFTDPARIKLQGDSVMIVVHESSAYDARLATKRGLDEAVSFAKDRKIPVIYLQDDSPERFYFVEDCNPDYWVYSQGGEISFDVAPTHVYIVGGHLEICMSATLHDLLYQWSKKPARNLRVTYLMDAIYSNGKLVDPADPFYADFSRFMSIVSYGRPGGEHWPKLSLLESMGIIVRQDHQLEYIRQILPRWDRTFPDTYRVEVQLNDSVKKVLRPASGWRPPTLLFHFVDSAVNLSTPPLAPGN
ncbi:MAG: hypothetical protein K9K30_00810 [Burkholderiaceae bacterium]|nr:hypothetical protein [Sulfuritalea sp.]MCF8173768.1 hypothetical protein [Burkholderiaceae bacterium]MCF8184082.1 hypothetical protein [Polynucleobacter sp.]